MKKPFAFCVHAALALAAIPFTVAAESSLDYSYLELGYIGVVGTELDGFAVNGSIEVGDAWFAFGRYGRDSYSRAPPRISAPATLGIRPCTMTQSVTTRGSAWAIAAA